MSKPLASTTSSEPVLTGFAESLAAIESCRSLLDAGHDVHLVCRKGSRAPSRHIPGVRVHDTCAPESDTQASISEISELTRRIGARVFVPLDDAALWLARECLDRDPDLWVFPRRQDAVLALDKRLQIDAAISAGCAVPATTILSGPDQLTDVDRTPCMIRPAFAAREIDGRLGRSGAAYAKDTVELKQASALFPTPEPLMVQEPVAGTGEGSFAIASEGIVHVPSAHERVRMVDPGGSGSSACRSRPLDASQLDCMQRFANNTGWQGHFMIEWLRDKSGQLWFVELNGRAWGSLALSRRQGLEYPAWTVATALGGVPDVSIPELPHFTCRHAARELLHLAKVLRGRRRDGPGEWPSRFRTLVDVLRIRRSDRWYNLDRRDPALFLRDLSWTLSTALRKKH